MTETKQVEGTVGAELAAIELKGVVKTFQARGDAVRAVKGVDVSIGEGEFFSLLGPSGCGKTTTMRMIAGFDEPTEGEVFLHGRNVVGVPPNRRDVNMVFQSYALFPHMSVFENVAFGLRRKGVARNEVARRAGEMLEIVDLKGREKRRPRELSGGQQQRVALARALVNRPRALLLDEPLGALDLKLRQAMQVELKRIQREVGITFVYVTHDQNEALTMSDRIAVMSAGRILQIGTPRDIYDRPAERFVADFIGESNFLPAEVRSAADGRATVRLSSSVEIPATLPEGFAPSGKVTIVLRPEHLHIAPEGAGGALQGLVENVVYLGTDTHFHLKLDDGAALIVRQQNSRGGGAPLTAGSRAGVAIGENAAQVLKD